MQSELKRCTCPCSARAAALAARAPSYPDLTRDAFVKPSVWVGLATQTSLLSTTITMLAAPLAALIGAGISQGTGKLVNVAMPFAVTWLLANLQPSVIYFAIVGIALVAAIVVIAVGPETRAKRLG